MLVIIDLDPTIDNEQLIFDTINSTGVQLTSTDIIKNKLFQKLKSFNVMSEDDLNDYYIQHWYDIFEKDEDTTEYWCFKKKTGRFTRQVSEILLHSIALIKPNFYDPEKNQITDIPVIYKKYIDNMASADELKKFVDSNNKNSINKESNMTED